MHKIKYILCFLFVVLGMHAQPTLSKQAQVSLLTSSPDNSQVFTLYGHTALRVKDMTKGIDLIFNYGIFDFNQSNFIYRFSKGQTDYKLGVANFQDYIIEYQMRGSEVVEQVLNLTPEETLQVWNYLVKNYEPQNRVYRYNFFFDNCSTRPRDIIEQHLTGKLNYGTKEDSVTFRDLINHCTRNFSWLTFGCDLALGAPTDDVATAHQKMFLPQYLLHGFEHAAIEQADGSKRKLVKETNQIAEGDKGDSIQELFTPLVVGWLSFALGLIILLFEYKKRKHYWWIDAVLFFIAGIAGFIIFFLVNFSEHPCMHPNWSLVWLNPIQLVAAILFLVKRANFVGYYYHFINFAVLLLFLMCWNIVPQYLNIACIPFILLLWSRSFSGVVAYIRLERSGDKK